MATKLHCKEIFDSKYLRCNRSRDWKILRCFPKCANAGHRSNGFCGNTIAMEFENEHIDGVSFYAWAFVIPTQETVKFKVGQQFDLKTLVGTRERSKEFPRGEWVRGYIRNSVISFNTDLMSWNYSWDSSKHASRIQTHVLQAILCSQVDGQENLVSIVASFTSSLFHVLSRAMKREFAKTSSSSTTRTGAFPSDDSSLIVATEVNLTFACTTNMIRDRLFSFIMLPPVINQAVPVTSTATRARIEQLAYLRGLHKAPVEPGLVISLLTLADALSSVLGYSLDAFVARNVSEIPTNFPNLVYMCEKERDISFEWSLEREYGDFNLANGIEISVYGYIRDAFRKAIDQALLKCFGMELKSFSNIMELASNNGLIPQDPLNPLYRVTTKRHLEIQAGTTIARMSDYSKLMLLWRRGLYRKLLVKTMLPAKPSSIYPSFAMSAFMGDWIDESLLVGEKLQDDLKDIAGIDSKMFREIISRVRLTISHSVAQFEWFGSDNQMVPIIFDGQVHRLTHNISSLFRYYPDTKYCAFMDDAANFLGCLHTDVSITGSEFVQMSSIFSPQNCETVQHHYVVLVFKFQVTGLSVLSMQMEQFLVPEKCFTAVYARNLIFGLVHQEYKARDRVQNIRYVKNLIQGVERDIDLIVH